EPRGVAIGPGDRDGFDFLPVSQPEAGDERIVRLVAAARLDVADLPPAVGSADLDPRADAEAVLGPLVVEPHLEARAEGSIVAPAGAGEREGRADEVQIPGQVVVDEPEPCRRQVILET